MQVTIAATQSEMELLVPLWAELHVGHPAATPFNSPAWTLSWGEAWRRGPCSAPPEWRCAAGWAGERRLTAVLPLVRSADGVTRHAAPELVDYTSALTGSDDLAAFWRLAAAALRRRDGAGQLIVPVMGERDLAALAEAGLSVRATEAEPCALIDLPATWDDYCSALPSGRRRLWRSERRRLAAAHGPVGFDVCRGGSELPGRLSEFWRLREESWRRRGRYEQLAPRTVGDPVRWFLEGVARRTALGAQPAVARLRVGEIVAAMALMFRAGNRVWYYMSAYDVAYARYGVGRMLLADSIRHAVADLGMATFDLGRGIEPYKFAMGARRYDLTTAAISL